jgi:hypothetical protein
MFVSLIVVSPLTFAWIAHAHVVDLTINDFTIVFMLLLLTWSWFFCVSIPISCVICCVHPVT